MLLEQVTEMALIIKAGSRRNLGDRVFRFRQLARGPVEAKGAQIFAHCCPVVFFESARQMCRMNADYVRDLDEVKRVVEPSMEQIACLH